MTLLIAYVAMVICAINAAIASLVALAWWLHLRFWSRRLTSAAEYEETCDLTMPDGGLVSLRRLKASTVNGRAGQTPVLLIHGLAMSHQCLDLGEHSLARKLQAEAFDVWLLTLRSGRTHRGPFGPRTSNFAAMVEHDIPRAVEHVLEKTGQPWLDVAALSMGGMLLYATLGRTLHASKVRRAVFFGSPGAIRPLGLIRFSRLAPSRWALSAPLRLLHRSVAFAPRLVPGFIWSRLYNPHNMHPDHERLMHWNVWEDIPGQLGRDFVEWSVGRGVVSVHGKPVLAGLSEVDVPALFFAGAVDWLAPVDVVRAAYDAWGSALPLVEKRFLVMGRETSGAEHDYGHCDLVLGRNVVSEVFTPAVEFLCAQDQRQVARSMPCPKASPDPTVLALPAG